MLLRPAAWVCSQRLFPFRAVEKAQVTSGLHIAVQARGVGGLHASLLSGTDDKPAAPVRQLLRACLRSEVSACRAIVDASPVVEWVSQDNCIVPAMPVISTIQSLAVRERCEKMMVGPMFVGYKCASAAWAVCEKVRVGLRGVGKERLWDRFKVKFLICVEHEAVEFARQVSSGHAH